MFENRTRMEDLSMDEEAANKLAAAIGGDVWQSGGGIHVVTIKRPDGGLVVFSEDLVAEYDDEQAFEDANPSTTILLRTNPTDYWVIESEDGHVWMQDREHGRGWASEDDAKREAGGIQSRVGRCWVRHQRPSDTTGE